MKTPHVKTAYFIVNPSNQILPYTGAEDTVTCVSVYCQGYDSEAWKRMEQQGFRVMKATIMTQD